MLHIQSRTKLSETTMSDSAGFRVKKKSQDPRGSVKNGQALRDSKYGILDFTESQEKMDFAGFVKQDSGLYCCCTKKKQFSLDCKKVDKKLPEKGIKTPT